MGSYGNAFYGEGDYVDPGDYGNTHLKAMMDHYYQSSYPANAALWVQGSIDSRFHTGDQTLWSMIYCDNQYYQSRRFFFNLGLRHVNMIAGRQRQNRKSTISVPIQNQTDSLADDYNKVLKWCEERDGFQEYISEAFEGCLITGMNLLHLYPDYTRDPVSGDLCTDRIFYNNYLIDPYFRKQGLEDCQFVWRRRWVYKSAAIALLPGHAKEIEKMKPSGMKDGRFPLQAELLNLDTNRLFALDEFHYRTTRKAKMIIDPKTGESMEWEEQEDEDPDMLKRVLQLQPWLITKEIDVPTVKLVITLGGHIFYHGKTLLGLDKYPFVPVICYHFPDIQSYQWRLFGIWRNLRDSQFLYNMRKVIELDILQSQINSGWLYQIDSVVDPKAFRQSGQGFLVPVKAGKNINEAVQRIEAPSIPQSMIELSKNLAENITQISGVNEELLGSATDDKAGILSMLRQGAGLTTLQNIFDRLDYSQRLYGQLRLEAIQKNFSKAKIARILGHEPHEQFFKKYSLKYSIAVEEGNYSTTQRQTELMQLLHFREIGMPISDKSIMDAAFITNKAKIAADMQEASERQAQMQQAQMQSQQQKDQADVMQKFAKTRSELAKEKEHLASAHEKTAKIVDIQASAEHKQMESDLNLVKMAMELEDVQFNQIKNAFELAEAIKAANSVNPNTQPQVQGG